MAAVACFGEILLRMTAPGRELMLQKPHLDVYVAGAEANVGVGLANLGHEVRMVSRLPSNVLGQAAVDALRRHGVDVSGIARTPDRMGLYFLTQGAGLRASQALILAGKARALILGRYHVSIGDIQALARPVLRHRVIPNFYAESERISADNLIERLLEAVPLPRSGM